MLKIAGVVILYNPKKEINENILSYINQVDFLYVVDNSELPSDQIEHIIKSNPKSLEVVRNNVNVGIASALNIAAKKAIENGFDLLLTMDQDSRVSENYVSEMLLEFERDECIGILSPYIIHTKNPRMPVLTGLVEVATAMTSGSVIKLSAHVQIGGFLEKLFIDYVDNEYCLRMKKSGYKIFRNNSIYIYHELGEAKARKFIYKKVFPTNHSPRRWYYRTRNRFYVYKEYKNEFPDYIKFDKRVFIKDIVKILLYEKNKIQKFKMILIGYRDFKRDNFGRLID
jgi:rhamnosyltransferase